MTWFTTDSPQVWAHHLPPTLSIVTSPNWLWIRWDPTPRLLCRLTPCRTAPPSLCPSSNRNLNLCPHPTLNLTTAYWTYLTTFPNLYSHCAPPRPVHPPYNHINRDKTTTLSSDGEIWIQTDCYHLNWIIFHWKLDDFIIFGANWLKKCERYNLTVTKEQFRLEFCCDKFLPIRYYTF